MHVEAIAPEARAGRETGSGLPRWADAVVALFALIVAAPFIALLALGIAMSSSGPVFFRQKRVGRNGQLFDLHKLCTMKPSAAGPQVTAKNDARITGFGRFLRRTKLDELPTFWNVLRGEMALVGPRPEVPRYVDPENPIWKSVLAVRPGLTDPVTLSLRNEEELLAEIENDTERYYTETLQPAKLNGYLAYLHERTWRTDLQVLGKTLAAIAKGNKK